MRRILTRFNAIGAVIGIALAFSGVAYERYSKNRITQIPSPAPSGFQPDPNVIQYLSTPNTFNTMQRASSWISVSRTDGKETPNGELPPPEVTQIRFAHEPVVTKEGELWLVTFK